MLNEAFSLRDLDYSTAALVSETPRHRWYIIKEAFAAKMVESALADAEISPQDVVLDPFCGSGTVPVTTALRGGTSMGFEVNPFMAFVSRTKLLSARGSTVRKVQPSLTKGAKSGAVSPLEGFSTFSESVQLKKWLFNEEVLRSFEGGWQTTKSMQNPVRDIVRLALIGSAMDNCNAVADGKCLRYRKDWASLRLGRESFLASLDNRLEMMAEDLDDARIVGSPASIVQGDSRRTLERGGIPSFNLCVTSPPYLNSFDYTDVYRPELFLSKFIKTPEELRQLRFNTFRSHVQVAWERPELRAFGPIFEETMQRLKESTVTTWNRNIPDMIRGYFEDVEKILLHLRRLASPGASLWIVVSTSAYAGVEIPVDLIYAEVGERTGWELREVGVLRRLRSSGQHRNNLAGDDAAPSRLRESVVIFDVRGKVSGRKRSR